MNPGAILPGVVGAICLVLAFFALAASPVQFDETPLQLSCAPGHGEHTDALLAELGFSEEEIIDFKVKSVVL